MWGATVANVFKVLDDGGPLETVDTVFKEITPASVISGAYTLVDREGIFYVPQGTFIAAYGDRRAGVPTSRIAELRTYHLPADLLGDEDDEAIVGLNLTWDGYLLIVTRSIRRLFTDLGTEAGLDLIDLPEGVRLRETGAERFWFNTDTEAHDVAGRHLPAIRRRGAPRAYPRRRSTHARIHRCPTRWRHGRAMS